MAEPLNPLFQYGIQGDSRAVPVNPLAPPQAATVPQGPTMADAWTSTSNTLADWLKAQRAQSAAQGLIDPETGWPTRAGLDDAMSQYTNAMMLGTSAPGPAGIRAFHGSPHDFDKFSLGKIGTGEGAQAYGHGLYFAGEEAVAKSYRDALAKNNQRPVTIQTPFGPQSILEQDPTRPGRMYEVNINANPEHFLDWDKPFAEQSAHVQDALRKLGVPDREHVTGDLAYKHLAGNEVLAGRGRPGSGVPEINAATVLREAGIPGIRYLDGGSRGAGEGTYNHVVFDEATIEILRKYGLAGLMAGAGAAGTTATPPEQ